MRCSECKQNKGFCTKPIRYKLDKEYKDMIYSAWETNNKEEKCMFWTRGKARKTHGG